MNSVYYTARDNYRQEIYIRMEPTVVKNAIRDAAAPAVGVAAAVSLSQAFAPRQFLTGLLWAVPASWAAVSLLLAAGRRFLRSAGEPEDTAAWVTAPLVWLAAAPAALILNLPAAALLWGGAMGGLFLYRLAMAISRSGRVPVSRLESMALWLPFLPAFIVFFQLHISHDAFQYLGLLSSAALDGDLDLFNQAYLANADRFYNPFALRSARYLGTPLLEAPFFAAGHLLRAIMALAGKEHAATGFTFPYLLCVGLATPIFVLAGLVVLYRLVRSVYGRAVSLTSVMGIFFSSPLFFFAFLWNGWPHPFGFFFSGLFLLAWHETRGRRDTKRWLVLGALGGVLMLIRPTNSMLAVFPLVELAAGVIRKRPAAGWRMGPLAGIILAAFIFSPQLTVWKSMAGSISAGPYLEVGDRFNWLRPELWGTFFDAARHGLFAWSPLLLFILPGLVLLRRTDRILGAASIIYTVLYGYVYSCWSVWWTGAGFGNRFFIEWLPVGALALAALLAEARRRSPRLADCAAAILGFYATWNLFLVGAFRANIVPYAIPEPGWTFGDPPTFAGILYRQLVIFPRRLETLLRTQWGNESFFPPRLATAWKARDVPAAIWLIGILMASAALLWLTARWAMRMRSMPSRKRMSLVLAAIVMAVAGLHLVLAHSRRHTVMPGRFHHLDPRGARLKPGAEIYLPIGHEEPVITVDLLSSLAYGQALPQGAVFAEAVLELRDGRRIAYPLRVGIETAEGSFHRPETSRALRHNVDRALIQREYASTAFSRSVYSQLVYRAGLRLPEPVIVTGIRLVSRSSAGELVLADIFLRDF